MGPDCSSPGGHPAEGTGPVLGQLDWLSSTLVPGRQAQGPEGPEAGLPVISEPCRCGTRWCRTARGRGGVGGPGGGGGLAGRKPEGRSCSTLGPSQALLSRARTRAGSERWLRRSGPWPPPVGPRARRWLRERLSPRRWNVAAVGFRAMRLVGHQRPDSVGGVPRGWHGTPPAPPSQGPRPVADRPGPWAAEEGLAVPGELAWLPLGNEAFAGAGRG